MPPTRASLPKTLAESAGPSSSRTLTYVHQAESVPVEQEEKPTLRDGPVVTPRPPARSAGPYSRKSTEESHLSSRRSRLEPLPLRAQLEQLLAIFRRRTKVIRGEKPWVRIPIVLPRPGVPGRGHYSKLPRPGVPGRGHCRPKFPARFPTGWHRRLLILFSNTPQCGVVLAAPVLFFAVVPFVVCRRRRVILLRGAVYDGRKGNSF